MKKLKFIPLILVPLSVIAEIIQNPDQYVYQFQGMTMRPGLMNIPFFLRFLVDTALTLLKVILPVIYLVSVNNAIKDKAYRLFRYIVLIEFFLWFPLMLMMFLFFLLEGEFVSSQITVNITTVVIYSVINMLTSVCLLLSKPEKKIPRIDISEYEMVAYTSKGHRFLHHLLDTLFFYSYFLYLTSTIHNFIFSDLSEGWGWFLLLIFYVVYYFASEWFFSQTLGKIITNSVVVSTSGPLTAGRMLKRSLYRIIPFEAFSFLGNGQWHDKISGTAVVYRDSWEKVFAEENQEEKSESLLVS